MEKLMVDGNEIQNLPGFHGEDAHIMECETMQQFESWKQGGDTMACRYQNQVYIKIPKTLSDSEFSLDYDCLPLEEANARIEKWNTEQPL